MRKLYIIENKDYLKNPCSNCEHGWGACSKGQDKNGKFIITDSCYDHPCVKRDEYLNSLRRS